MSMDSQPQANSTIRFLDNQPEEILMYTNKENDGWFKRSTLFLPAQFARYFIKMGEPRAERLQAITEEEARKEGDPNQGLIASENDHITWFKEKWDTINPAYPWSSNPYVFIHPFEYLKGYGNVKGE